MKKLAIWLTAIFGVLFLGSLAVSLFGFLLPWLHAESTMPQDGIFEVRQQEDGSLVVSWPEAPGAEYYYVEIFEAAESEEEPEPIYRRYVGETQVTLSEVPVESELTLRVNSVVKYQTLLDEERRYGEVPMEVTTRFDIPVISGIHWESDEEAKTVSLWLGLTEGELCHLYLLDEQGQIQETRELSESEQLLQFGEKGDWPVPRFGCQYDFAFDAYRLEPGISFYGYISAEMTVTRDDLLGRNLNEVITPGEDNTFTITWDETKGEHYEVQLLDKEKGIWNGLCQIPGDGEREYFTGHLKAFTEYTFRVVAVGGQVMEGSEFAAVSGDMNVETIESPVFATIWPTKELKAYKDPEKTEEIGKVKVAKAYCVLDEVNGMFAIRLGNETAYIDSNYCMINLPEYMGGLCSYKITNSYKSMYMAHEFEIPGVTGVVTAGYEKVKQNDGTYLVPLLYPTAQKLVVAALGALDEGYRIKIYDSYRPNQATRQMYSRTEKVQEDEIPEKPYTNVSIDSLKLPKGEPVLDDNGDPVLDEDGKEKTKLTYYKLMTDGRYTLNYFVAKGTSRHNQGVALDLTIESAETGKEIKMQTSIHDLSWYSELSRNNGNANKLAQIMKAAGFGGLTSEWWHFQDNDARNNLQPPVVNEGVTAECWVADDYGWKYRKAKGTFYVSETVTIDGAEYTFDENGYVIEETE